MDEQIRIGTSNRDSFHAGWSAVADILDFVLVYHIVWTILLANPCLVRRVHRLVVIIFLVWSHCKFYCYRVPFWSYMKLLFCLWLVLPIFNGAAYIYDHFVRKYVKVGGTVSSSYPESQRKVLLMMTPDARRSVEYYISKHGPEAFERVVKAVRNMLNTLLFSSSLNAELILILHLLLIDCRLKRKPGSDEQTKTAPPIDFLIWDSDCNTRTFHL